jgi:carboxyl-terminal processing protease
MHQVKGWIRALGLVALLVVGTSTTLKEENNRYFEISKNIEIFANLYRELNTHYVDDLDPGKLMRTGIEAMVGSLDPYTNYISESDIEGYRLRTEGRYNGIGAVSDKIGDYVTLIELYEGQPADKAGLKAGDAIVEVDGKNIVGKDLEEVNNFLRGFPGQDLELRIQRPGIEDPIDVKLTLGEVSVPNVPYHGMVADGIGYIALTTFTRDAGRNVAKALRSLKSDHPDLKGLVFDLRGNGGGLLIEAVNVSNVFIPKGEVVVSTRGKVKEWDKSYSTQGAPTDLEIPLIVLIDGNSASASEIVCGVIQDYDRGILIGQQSYGKGLVQNTREVGYNSRIKLTTAKYYIPSGRCIQSVEYEDGEPVDIPDDKRQAFQTRNGRTVLDGGGVRPDISLPAATDDAVVKSLIRQHFLFNFVTQYCQGLDSIAPVQEFEFTDFPGFMDFVEKQGFNYYTESERLVSKLEKANAKQGYGLETDLSEIKSILEKAKKDRILGKKEDIIDLIENDIASRYYYQTGKVKMRLKNDDEISEAIRILSDPEEYNRILTGKG